MFRCTECNKEYDIKPDYCDDCGNDVFVEVAPQVNETPAAQKQEEIKSEPQVQNIQESTYQKTPPHSYYEERKPIKKEELLSYIIFCMCLILSFMVVFVYNPKETPKEEVAKEKPDVVAQNIPTLDSFWNNTPAKPEPQKQTVISQLPQEQEPAKPVIVNPPQEVVQKPEPKTTTVKLKTVPITKNNIFTKKEPKQVSTKTSVQTKQPQTKTQSKIQTTQNKVVQQKPVTTSKTTVQKNTVQQKPTPVKTQVQTSQASKTTTQTTQSKPIQVNTQQSAQTATVQVQPSVDTAALRKELSTYKTSLRNTIGRKIDFTDVVGDGSCSIVFKIDSSGRLTNRAFSKQSTNTTLNDAVYKAVMSTPSYNPPPSGYKGETLTLKISFYNGNFEIALN